MRYLHLILFQILYQCLDDVIILPSLISLTIRLIPPNMQVELAEKMGVTVIVLSMLKEIDMHSGFVMLGIGLACVGITLLKNQDKSNA